METIPEAQMLEEDAASIWMWLQKILFPAAAVGFRAGKSTGQYGGIRIADDNCRINYTAASDHSMAGDTVLSGYKC